MVALRGLRAALTPVVVHAAMPRPGLSFARAIILFSYAMACAPAAQAASAASGLFYERALMSSADTRCALFTPGVAHALEAARDQARGAALRAGDDAAVLQATQDRAYVRAAAVDCGAPGLKLAAGRVRTAFADYARLSVMRFPGARSAWRAERADVRLTGPRWRLVQALPGSGGWLLFGVVDGRPALLDARRGAAPAATARLSLRDPARLARPFLSGPAPRSVAQVFLAAGRSAPARALLPAGAASGVLYTFPAAALPALAALDPRESGEVELVYPALGRERVFDAPLEVGDFAAAQAFIAAGALATR